MDNVAGIIGLVIGLGVGGFFIWCYVRIIRRAGYNGWWCLILIVPIVNFVMIWVFAFADWPALRGRGSMRRASGQVSPRRAEPEDYRAGGTIVDREQIHEPEPEPRRDTGRSSVRGWMLAGFDGDGHAVRLEFTADEIEEAGGLIVGRNPSMSDLVLSDGSVSRKHARFYMSGGELEIEDLESANGTAIDGQALEPGGSAAIGGGIEISFGETKLRLTGA